MATLHPNPAHPRMYGLIVLILLAIGLGAPDGHAATFGALARQDRVVIGPGQPATFDLLVWSDTPARVRLALISAPPRWDVRFPAAVNINENGSETVALGSTLVRATPITITAAPGTVTAGEYSVVVSAILETPSDGITVQQERRFALTAVLASAVQPRSPPLEPDITIDPPEEQPPNPWILLVPGIALIIFISCLIYRYA